MMIKEWQDQWWFQYIYYYCTIARKWMLECLNTWEHVGERYKIDTCVIVLSPQSIQIANDKPANTT